MKYRCWDFSKMYWVYLLWLKTRGKDKFTANILTTLLPWQRLSSLTSRRTFPTVHVNEAVGTLSDCPKYIGRKKVGIMNFNINFRVKEPRALSQRFGLPVLMENKKVATELFSLQMFIWTIVVLFLDIIFSWWPTFGLKIPFNITTRAKICRFLQFWQLSTLGKYRAQLNAKIILIYVIPLDKIYIINRYLFGIQMCSILAKCWKLSEMAQIAYFCSFYWIWVLINSNSPNSTRNMYPIQMI